MHGTPKPRVLKFGEFELNAAERTLNGPAGRPIQLTRRLSDALVFMAEHSGRLLEKGRLIEAIWPDVVVEENSLAQAISTLRRALGERAGERRYIETVSGIGYRFVPAVQVIEAPVAKAVQGMPSIAVLPFDDISAGGDQAYFAYGIAEEILNQLARIDGLRVIGKTSSFLFRGGNQGPQAIGAALAADNLLVGSVRKDSGRLRITAQLIDSAGGVQLWSESFDRELHDVFAIQDDIARAVARASSATLGVNEAHAATGGTTNLDAYDAYLRARAIEHQSGAQAMLRSAELYRQALRLDPHFVRAWVGLAEACRGALIFAPEHAEHARRELDEAVDRALALGPDLAVSHVAASWRCWLEHDWAGLERALVRARELRLGAVGGYHFYRAAASAGFGRADEGAEEFRLAARADPLSLLISSLLQLQLHIAGREREAEAEYQRSLDLPGNRDIAEHAALHRAWLRGDAAPEVRARFRRYLDHQTVVMPVLHEVFAVFDQPGAAAALLRRAAAEPVYRSASRQWILACWLAHYGDADGALDALQRSHVQLPGAQPSWLWLPVLASVRRSPMFKDLLRRMGLVDHWQSSGNWGDFARPTGSENFECR